MHRVLIGRIHLVISCECQTKTNLYHRCIVLQENNTEQLAVWSWIAFQSNFLNETMGKIKNDAVGYSYTVVVVFGILGNILVILSILRQKKNMLKNDYYFLVLHLAICDLAALSILIFNILDLFWLGKPLSDYSPMITCNIYVIVDAFQLIGIGMMLIISLLRYRAIVHPLKPAISRRKLKVVCGLVYLVGLIVGCGVRSPRCFLMSNVVYVAYRKFYLAFWISFGYFIPTIFMAVIYFRISRSLIKQSKYIKRVGSYENRRAPDFFFNILKYIQNRRTFRVCLSTVLCYGIANIPLSVWFMWFISGQYHLQMKYFWVEYFADVLVIAGSHSINPLIYGILDKQLLTFWKCCCKEKRKTQESQAAVVVGETRTAHRLHAL